MLPAAPGAGRHRLGISFDGPPEGAVVLDRLVIGRPAGNGQSGGIAVTWTAWFALAVTAAVVVGLARNLAADALLWGAVIACGLVGILSPAEMFTGFANTGMLTIAALYVVAAGVRETGALDLVGRNFLRSVRTPGGVMFRMGLAVPMLSAFLNNTPVVAMFIPMLSSWCTKYRVSPSRLLIPLSYMSILGGMTTLIGTSTNLVVHGMMAEAVSARPELAQSLRPMGLFEIGALGLPCALLGIGYLLFFSPRLLPQRMDMLEEIGSIAAGIPGGNGGEPGLPVWWGSTWRRRASGICTGFFSSRSSATGS